jgi:glutamine amidotransferase
MQVLFEASEERGEHAGLGLLPGRVRRLAGDGLKVPHTGWNELQSVRESRLLRNLPQGAHAYFNHSYYCEAAPEDVLAGTDYGGPRAAIVGRGRLYGIQFHPEKSQHVGLLLLRNFVDHG